jgi:putative DNA methylase
VRRLIETWLPIEALSEESVRERTPMTPYPAPNRLHVWWARRPLVLSRAAILAALLPEDADRDRFLHMIGIHGDPVAAKRRIERARRTGERFKGQAYDYKRAFTYLPTPTELTWFNAQRERAGVGGKVIVDPTAGGGSIPFEAVRLGLDVYSNDLNPVATIIQKATLEEPLLGGDAILPSFERLAAQFVERREERLGDLFPPEPNPRAISTTFLWARTIRCPYCEGLVPLSPNWRLAPDGTGVALRPRTGTGPGDPARRCDFAIVRRAEEQSEGTVKGGNARCPFPDCRRTVRGKEIKRQAQAGAMGEQLFAVVYKERVRVTGKNGRLRERFERGYRAPRPEDEVGPLVAARLAEKLPEWEALDIVPSEEVESAHPKYDPRRWAMSRWRDFFSPRQLLVHGTSVEIYRELFEEERRKGPLSEATKAAFVYLALALDKLRDYNSRMTRWHVSREVMVNTFDRHDFSFKWSYAEMAPLISGLGYDWAIEQTKKCLEELIELVRPEQGLALSGWTPPSVTVTCKSADALDHLADGSVDLVVIDPPYYDNVMYAELSDFFYVWLKRTAGLVLPELFTSRLTDKEHEAVANPARFKGEKGAKEKAYRDYRERMQRIFEECRRVVKPEGLMVLMFNHKATGAWDALATGLIEAGFYVTASWPVESEAEGSMHQKGKAAASSTILLVCRPRVETGESPWWEELEPEVARTVREKVAQFEKAGIRGVDLYLAAFGPALEVFSRHWPVRRGRPLPPPVEVRRRRQAELFPEPFDPYRATPEDALLVARREVKAWRLRQLLGAARRAELDPLTEWFVLAWDSFGMPRFPFDEALQLARVVGVDLERDVVGRIAEKKGEELILFDSLTRRAGHRLGPADGSASWLDPIHHAAAIAQTATAEAAAAKLEQAGVLRTPELRAALQAVLEVLPVGRTFTGVDPIDAVARHAADFDALERLRRVAFEGELPKPRQLELFEREAA